MVCRLDDKSLGVRMQRRCLLGRRDMSWGRQVVCEMRRMDASFRLDFGEGFAGGDTTVC